MARINIKSPLIQLLIALILGMLVPVLFAYVFYKTFYNGDDNLADVLHLFKTTNILTNLVLISIIPNLISVFLLNMFDKWNYLRGVFISIMIYICIAFFL